MSTFNMQESISQTAYHWIQKNELFPKAVFAILIKNKIINFQNLIKALEYELQFLEINTEKDCCLFYGDSKSFTSAVGMVTENEEVFNKWVETQEPDKLMKIML